jgi:chemotaxis regulatin CheY-phosphate phosphatase CheZ
MIHTEEGLRRTHEAVQKLESILASLECDKEKMHSTWYETKKEPALEQLQELQAEIDEYLRRATPTASESAPNMPVSV